MKARSVCRGVFLAATLGVTGCGDNNNNSDDNGSTPEPTPQATATVPPVEPTTTVPAPGPTSTPNTSGLVSERVSSAPSGIDDPVWATITPFAPTLSTVSSGLLYGNGQLNMTGTFAGLGDFNSGAPADLWLRSVHDGNKIYILAQWDGTTQDFMCWDGDMITLDPAYILLGSNMMSFAGAADAGDVLYQTGCAVCHGPSGGGGIGPALTPPGFTGISRADLDVEMALPSHPGAAAWTGLSAAEQTDLLARLRGFSGIPGYYLTQPDGSLADIVTQSNVDYTMIEGSDLMCEVLSIAPSVERRCIACVDGLDGRPGPSRVSRTPRSSRVRTREVTP